MKRGTIIKFLGLFISLFYTHLCSAQLANWSQSSGSIFPVNKVGQINGMTRISQLKHHPIDSNKMYAVTAEGGFFTSTDKGNNWAVKAGTENLTGSCASICIDYTNDQTIWLGSGDPNYYSNGSGIYKSIDGGNTFSATSLTNCLVVHIVQNPLNSSQYLAATNKGIYKSTNSGTTWVAKTSTSLQFVDMRLNPGNGSQTLFACTKDLNPRLYRSFDFGDTWTEITNKGLVNATTYTTGGGRIGLTKADTNVVYFQSLGGGGIIHKSVNNGDTFIVMRPEGAPYITFYDSAGPTSGLTSQGNYNAAFWVDQNNASHLWLQSHNTWESKNNGVSWSQLAHWASKIHTDHHQLEQAPFNNNLLISCNDGGIWFSTDTAKTWTAKCNGIGAFEIANNAGISAKTDKDFVSIGTQDNARLYGTADGWFTISGGDDYAKRVSDFNGFIYFDGTNRQKDLFGSSGTYGLPTSNWNAFAFNRRNKDLGFMGYTDVWITTNLSTTTPTWTQISTFNSAIKDIHSCIADPNRLYVLLTNGSLYVCNNALSASPAFTLHSVVSGTASSTGSIISNITNADILFVHKNNVIYRSADSGNTWTNVTYNLPNVNHRRILAEQYGGASELVFVATNNAVYYKKAGQTSWTIYSSNLPSRRSPTEFSMFDDSTNFSKIRYATYGRSMWETPFGNLRPFAAFFTVSQAFYCSTGQNVEYKDNSTGNNLSYSWSFPGGTPSTSTAKNPIVTYASAGSYSAALTVKDGTDSVTITKTNCVVVNSSAPTTNTGCIIASNSNLNNGFGIGIGNFELGSIKNSTSSNDGQYNDYTCSKYTTLIQGSTYNATVKTGTSNAEAAKLFIDWNDNGIFDAAEMMVSFPSNTSGTRTLSFVVPNTGVVLNKGLRARIVSKWNASPSTACDFSSYGQAEDYTVIVQTPAYLYNFSNPSTICLGSSTKLKVNIAAGTSPYTLVISDGTSNTTINNYLSDADISVSPLSTKTYTIVSVTDASSISLTGSGTVTVTVSMSGSCNTDSAALTPSNTSVKAIERTGLFNNWTYYADPADSTNYLFGIYKNGNTVSVDSVILHTGLGYGNTDYAKARTTPDQRAVCMMKRLVQVKASGSFTSNGGVKVRIYYDTAEMIDAVNRMDQLKTDSSMTGMPSWSWFKTGKTIGQIFSTMTALGIDPSSTGQNHLTWSMPDSMGTQNGIRFVQFHNIQSFSTFGGGLTIGNATPLPIELASFSATCIGTTKRLEWTTASEKDCHYFEIEESSNAIDWKTIGKVNGNGTTQDKHNYVFIINERTSLSYYRLKQVDINGQFYYFKIIRKICADSHDTSKAYPIPFDQVLNINSNNSTYFIVNSLGVKIYQGQDQVLLTSEWKKGIYFLVLNNETIKLLKE